jgi:hypothetical protein
LSKLSTEKASHSDFCLAKMFSKQEKGLGAGGGKGLLNLLNLLNLLKNWSLPVQPCAFF